ncbi:MAG: hypothetical protein WBA66_13280 [Xanthobacteraceae bacterium]
MAPLPREFDTFAVAARAALSEGRREDAITVIVERLRTGNASAEMQAIAADLLRPPQKRGKGRPKSQPQFWYEIGTDLDDLMGGGLTYENAIEALAKKYGVSERHVGNAARYYRDAKAQCI